MPQAGIFSPERNLARGALSRAVSCAGKHALKHAAIPGETVFACSPAMPHEAHGRRCRPCLCWQGCSPAWPYSEDGLLVALDGNILNLADLVDELYPGAAAGKKPGQLLVKLYRAPGGFPVEKFFGDFTLSVYEKAGRALSLYRSGSGSRPARPGSEVVLLGAAGGVELIVCALAIRNEIAPPTINYETPDPECDLDYVPNEPRALKIKTAMSNALGFGGHNATLVVSKFK